MQCAICGEYVVAGHVCDPDKLGRFYSAMKSGNKVEPQADHISDMLDFNERYEAAMSGVSQGPKTPRNPAHEDRIERLDDVFYIRWTSGPNYEWAFICIEDGEPDMNDIARVSFNRAKTFATAYRAAKSSPPSAKPL